MSSDGGFGGIGMTGMNFQAQTALQQSSERTPEKSDNAFEAAQKFESYLAQLMLREMRKTVPEGGVFSGPSMDTFIDMFDQTVADRIAEGGRLGLAAQIAGAIAPGGEAGMTAGGLPPIPGVTGRTIPFATAGHAHPEAPGAHVQKLGWWPVKGAISSDFGHRTDPFTGEDRHHAGMDIAAAEGTPIRAVESGEVVLAGRRKGYGNVVMVRHDDGTTGLYAHCRDVGVAAGTRISAGQSIATVGSTGRATGPHLHFELRTAEGAVDPQTIYDWARR
jgi:murein DD-endopeptidase MepM/ murein hydrolase activator NlpD